MHTPSDSSEFGPSEHAIKQVAKQALDRHEGQKGNLLPVLHTIQHALGCIPASAVPVLAEALQLSRAEIHGVISFYPHFRETPAGAVTLQVCRAESCQAMGATALADHAMRRLGCDFHSTTSNGAVTLEPVYCLGLCAQSPAITLNGQPHARMTATKLDSLLAAEGV